MELNALIIGIGLGAAFAGVSFVLQRRQRSRIVRDLSEQMRLQWKMLQEGESHALVAVDDKARLDGECLPYQNTLDGSLRQRRQALVDQRKRFSQQEEKLERRFDQLDQRERDYDRRLLRLEEEQRLLQEDRDILQAQLLQAKTDLETIAKLSSEEAKQRLISSIAEDAQREAVRMVREIEEEARAKATKRAQDIVATAIQRYSGAYVAEHTVSVVTLPSDDMKGRIIGREGRNIRAFESITGCDLIIDDTPEAVVISGFHPVRRQVAKRALEELVSDGRIHPARIEEIVERAQEEIETEIMEAGEQAVLDLGLHGIHTDMIHLLGALKFRTSYTQNVLNHSLEVAFFAGIMAEELGLDGDLARRCGLLHDIGKAVDHEQQGSHAVIGGKLAKKYKEHPVVVNAVWSHHYDIEPTSVYGPLTNAADALSAARPGARRENVQTYIKRLESLERIAGEFSGVENAYAIQAGRELRVIVNSEQINDEGAMMLVRNIARQIENEITYSGQIKVTVIREMRAMDMAY
ncbi:ribonuclease Y [Magnetococcales bacterium HHB-1]